MFCHGFQRFEWPCENAARAEKISGARENAAAAKKILKSLKHFKRDCLNRTGDKKIAHDLRNCLAA
jgi:hypothetical protein